MSHSFAADSEPAKGAYVCTRAERFSAGACRPELGKLMELRDALLVLKGPLANIPGWRGHIERRLFNNDVYERVLGKLASDTTAWGKSSAEPTGGA